MKVRRANWTGDALLNLELAVRFTRVEDARWCDHAEPLEEGHGAREIVLYFLAALTMEERIRLLQESLAEAMNTDAP